MESLWNTKLLRAIPQLTGSTQQQMADAMQVSRGSYQWTMAHSVVKCHELMHLCNHFHLHMESFFDDGIPYPLVDNTRKWKPYQWHPENMRLLWSCRTNPVVRRKDLMDGIGIGADVGRSTILRISSPQSRIDMDRWAMIVRKFDIDPLLIFVDPAEAPNHMRLHPYPTLSEDTISVAEESTAT